MASKSPEIDIDVNNIEYSHIRLHYNAQIEHQQKSFENSLKAFQQSIRLFQGLSSFFIDSNDSAKLFSPTDKQNKIEQSESDKYFYNQFHRLIALKFKYKGHIDNQNGNFKLLTNILVEYTQLLEEIDKELINTEQFKKLIAFFNDFKAAVEVLHRERATLIVLINSCRHKSSVMDSNRKTNSFLKKQKIKNLPPKIMQLNSKDIEILNQEKADLKKKLYEYETIHLRNYFNLISNFSVIIFNDIMSFFKLIDSTNVLILHNCMSKLMSYLSRKNNTTIMYDEQLQLEMFYNESVKNSESILISEYYHRLTSDSTRLFVVPLMDKKFYLQSFLKGLNKCETIDLSQVRSRFSKEYSVISKKNSVFSKNSIEETSDLIEEIRIQLQAIDYAKKEKLNLKLSHLEDQIALFKKQFKLFFEVSKYFAEKPINPITKKEIFAAATASSAKKGDKAAEYRLFFKKIANDLTSNKQSDAKMLEPAEFLYLRLEKNSYFYASRLKDIAECLPSLKEMQTLAKFCNELHLKEKLLLVQNEKCLNLIKEYDSLRKKNHELTSFDLKKIEQTINDQFSVFKKVYLDEYNAKLHSFDEKNYEKLMSLFRSIDVEGNRVMQEIVKMFTKYWIDFNDDQIKRLAIKKTEINKKAKDLLETNSPNDSLNDLTNSKKDTFASFYLNLFPEINGGVFSSPSAENFTHTRYLTKLNEQVLKFNTDYSYLKNFYDQKKNEMNL